MELTQEPSWMDPIVAYLKTGEQLEDKTEARILRLKVARYILYDDKLYRKGYKTARNLRQKEYVAKFLKQKFFECCQSVFFHLFLLKFDPNYSKDAKVCILKILRLFGPRLGERRLL